MGVIDLPNADTTPVADRRNLRLAAEQDKFDEEYYL